MKSLRFIDGDRHLDVYPSNSPDFVERHIARRSSFDYDQRYFLVYVSSRKNLQVNHQSMTIILQIGIFPSPYRTEINSSSIFSVSSLPAKHFAREQNQLDWRCVCVRARECSVFFFRFDERPSKEYSIFWIYQSRERCSSRLSNDRNLLTNTCVSRGILTRVTCLFLFFFFFFAAWNSFCSNTFCRSRLHSLEMFISRVESMKRKRKKMSKKRISFSYLEIYRNRKSHRKKNTHTHSH